MELNGTENFDAELKELLGIIAEKLDKPGRRCIIDQEIGVLAARIIADCPVDRKPMVTYILKLVGFNVANLETTEELYKMQFARRDVGKIIRFARERYYVSMTKLAEWTNISRPLIYAYKDEKNIPDEKNAKKILKELEKFVPGITIEYYRSLRD